MWANLYYIAINRPAEEVNRHYIMSLRLFAVLMFPLATALALALPTLVPLILGLSHSALGAAKWCWLLSVRRQLAWSAAFVFTFCRVRRPALSG